eukprot:TRINITY_DN2774_c0_g1_i1.p1 TRINITY_DN2774_c0_g1~~TRINITY_DN2774_c0_g1_i1.p1  ORF type:complete len:281 (-),score=67.88 TRINITY_DN2774_c0_g1_i1:749-1591(-)
MSLTTENKENVDVTSSALQEFQVPEDSKQTKDEEGESSVAALPCPSSNQADSVGSVEGLAFLAAVSKSKASKRVAARGGTVSKKSSGGKGAAEANKGGRVIPKCVAECQKGGDSKNPCWQKRKGRRGAGKLSCTEVFQRLRELGLTDFSRTSRCALAGIMQGYIKIPEEATDLDVVIFKDIKVCPNKSTATLRELLEQLDNPEVDDEASISCGTEDCECYNFMTDMCTGRPYMSSSKGHNHCGRCPGFGRCLGDYRMSCYNSRGQHTSKARWYDRWGNCY